MSLRGISFGVIILVILDIGCTYELRELTCNSYHSSTKQTRGISVTEVAYKDDNPRNDTMSLSLDPCSHRNVGKLQINWSFEDQRDQRDKATWLYGTSNNRQLDLCVSVVHVINGFQKEEMCYKLSAEDVRTDTSLFCLLDMTLGNRMIVNVYVTFRAEATILHYHGNIDTSTLDLSSRCRYVCDVIPVIPTSVFLCHAPFNVTVNNVTEVAGVTITDSNGTEYRVQYIAMTKSIVEITMPNTTEGQADLKLITYHSMSGVLCSYVKNIKIVCGFEHVPGPVVTSPEGEEFSVFLLFSAIVSVIIITIIITIALAVCHFPSFRKWYLMKQRRGSDPDVRLPIRRDSLPLHERHTTRLNNANVQHQTIHEVVSHLNGFVQSPNSRTSMLACSFLFAPMLYDHYTKKCMSRLQTVLTLNGLFPSDCLFDIVNIECEPGQIYQLIDSLTTDSSKIVVFLCFRNPGGNDCERTISDDLLENFRPPKLRPKCNVIIVVVTDVDQRHKIEETYYGEVFHLMQEDEYRGLISTVLKTCGFSVDTMDEALTKIVNSKESVEFLEVIGAPYGRIQR